jgi:hypothetical protein
MLASRAVSYVVNVRKVYLCGDMFGLLRQVLDEVKDVPSR